MTASYTDVTHQAPPSVEPLTMTAEWTALVEALATTSLVIARTGLASLGGALLEGRGDHLIVTTANYESTLRVRVPGVDADFGRIVVDHTEMTKLLAALTKGRSRKDLDGLRIRINAADPHQPVLELEGYRVPLTAMPMENFPQILRDLPVVAQLDREYFTAEATRVLRTVGTDDTLPMFAGLYIKVGAGALTLVGTDRYRLAIVRVPAVTVPTKTTQGGAVVHGGLLTKLLKRLTGERLRVGWLRADSSGSARQIPPTVSLSSGDTTLITSSISTTFTKYAHVLPTESHGSAVADRAWMQAETRRAAAVLAAKKDAGQVAVVIDPLEVRVAPALAERGEQVSTPARDAIVADIEEPLEYRFNPDYLLDALDSFPGETITMHPTGNTNRPLVFTDTPAELLNPGAFRHLLMPVRKPES